MGEDINEVLKKMPESILQKFVPALLEDTTYDDYVAAISSGNVKNAYRFIHTLKGTTKQLGFYKLSQQCSEIQEALRPANEGNSDDISLAKELTPQFIENYTKLTDVIKNF